MAEEDKDDGKQVEGDPHGGTSEFDNFQRLLKRVLSAPKEKIDEQRAECGQEKKEKRPG